MWRGKKRKYKKREERADRGGEVGQRKTRREEEKPGEDRRRKERGSLPPPSHCSFLDVIVPSAWDSSFFCRIKLVFCLAISGKSTFGLMN